MARDIAAAVSRAPAASGLGETLAIVEDQLLENEKPALVEEQTWDSLPADPR